MAAVSLADVVRVIETGDADTTLFVVTALVLVCSYSTAGMILIAPASSALTGLLFFTVAAVWLARATGPLHGVDGADLAAFAHPVVWTLLVVALIAHPGRRPFTGSERALLTVSLAVLPLLTTDSRITPPSPTDPCLICLPAPGWTVAPYLPVAARLAVVVVAVWLAVVLARRRGDPRIVAVLGVLLCVQVFAAAVVPLLTTPPGLVWLVGNAAGVILQMVIPPLVLFANARGWQADAALWKRRYTQEATDGRQRARTEIERDLHDGAQLRLVNAALLLQMARSALGGTRDEADAHLDTAVTELTLALSELRLLSRGQRPPALNRRELHEALGVLAANTPARVRIEGRPRAIPPLVAELAYFTVAEALANAIRHGAARNVVIRLRKESGCLHLAVCDDGKGGARVYEEGGLGQLGRRAEELGGRLGLESRPGAGTTLRVVIPCASSLQTTRS
ncbi:sensor histidine kinase [Paractinoplanes hotanensis]|uniref:histidine kinase n=1 Tax=Paractinoplanes hotanensis TaxID=2906497 RepID=A0ABT0Y5Z0_9ACTN|nr:histidine kinase [Actinoplanes hotanensis]MCM4081445.1 histidine kinase [Actinoplanes hotanensis]